MKYANLADAQNQSFYMRWAGKHYQVFTSPSAGLRELRFNSTKVPCAGLKVVTLTDRNSTRVIVPRACIKKPPNNLRFQGVATAGVLSSDETKLSPLVPRG